MSRSGDSCLNCVARQRKCDGIRPVCRRCVREKFKCKGYSNPGNHIRGVTDFNKSRTAPISTIEIIDLGFSGLAPGGNYPGPSWASNISTREPGTPSERSDIDGLFSSHLTSHPSLDPSPAGNSQSLVLSVSIPRQAPTPPYHLTDIGIFGKVSRTSQSPKKAPKKDTHQSMTPGQASLFDALFSLAQPENHKDILGGFTCLDHNPPGPILAGPSYNLEYDVKQTLESHSQRDLEDSQDAYQVGAKLCESLALDKKVKSNTLPFVLQSYALWMKQFLFEPIRIIPLAREYTFEEYSGGPQARWRMTTISNVVRAITGSTGYTLKDLEILQSHMHQGFVTTISNFGADQTADRIKALMAMSTTYEFISVMVKVLPLSMLVKTMQIVAPIFRRACPDPEDRPVNLPNLLSNINVGLQYYATVDIILSAVISQPMNFRYDTSFTFGVYESIFDLENGPGTRWVYGMPDRLLITIARMNWLLEEFGPCVDPKVIKELELEIQGAKAVALASADPILGFARLVVQECWRQAAYIYLYMGLCGADSDDARVVKAHEHFMKLFMRTKPGRIPDSFLVFPLPILGIATRHPDEQGLLKRRMLALPECARKDTAGNQFIRILECMWGLVNESGRPTTWSDLRLASLYVAGV